MKQNNRNRRNGHFGNRGARPAQTIYRNTVLESTGPSGKLRGTPLQLAEKYQAAAKDAMVQNDTVLAEKFAQYADHYMRLQNQAIENEKANASFHAPEVTQNTNPDEIAPLEVVEAETDTIDQIAQDNLSVPVQEMQLQEDSNSAPIQQ